MTTAAVATYALDQIQQARAQILGMDVQVFGFGQETDARVDLTR